MIQVVLEGVEEMEEGEGMQDMEQTSLSRQSFVLLFIPLPLSLLFFSFIYFL